MKRIFSSNNVGDVGLLRNRLDETGIAYEVRNETTPYPLHGLCPEIWVIHDADFFRACELRDGLHRSLPVSEESWTCPACGEQLEGQFTSCWKCGTARS